MDWGLYISMYFLMGGCFSLSTLLLFKYGTNLEQTVPKKELIMIIAVTLTWPITVYQLAIRKPK